MSDDLVFNDEQAIVPLRADALPWQVMVVDDEPAVHEVTKLVMAGFEMDGRGLEFTHCYSGAEARAVLATRNDIALILLDVVMESDHAGLEVARHIREDLGNLNVRIILRTGQPGQAPEEQVIKTYDINDYKEKTELTRRKLITVFYAGLRAYRDLMRIEQARLGLRRSIEAISEIHDSHNLRSFASAVLEQVNLLLNLNGEGLCASRVSAYTAKDVNGHIKVLAATQAFSGLLLNEEVNNLPQEVRTALRRTLAEKTSQLADHHYSGYFCTKSGSESVIYMTFPQPVPAQAQELLDMFSRNVAIAYDGLLLHEDTESALRATTWLLGGAIETRHDQPTQHLQRVSAIAALLAGWQGASAPEVELLRAAVSMHDVGKACIPDAILTKPGPLTPDEWTIIQTHPQKGHSLLSQSSSRVHTLAATIAHQHHEHWDGSGYPQGLQGTNISLEARITAVADVLDSLVSTSCYKQAWRMEDALGYLNDQSGKHFDPALIALVNAHRTEIVELFSS